MPSRLGPIFGTAVGIADILGLFRGSGGGGENARFSLNKFKAEVSKHKGLYQPSRFVVEIFPGPGAKGFWKDNVEDLRFLCSSASLPGVQIITSDHRRQNMGTFDRRPFGVQVTDIPLTFFVDNDGYVMKLFNDWTNVIINYSNPKNSNFGSDMMEHGKDRYGKGLFEVAYREDFISTVHITTFDQQQKNIVQYRLFEAFPMQVGDVTAAWAETDQFATLPVQFTFRNYTVHKLQGEADIPDQTQEQMSAPTNANVVKGRQRPRRIGGDDPRVRNQPSIARLNN